MKSYNILIATSSRAEYGILKPLIFELKKTEHSINILVTGSHLSNSFGFTLDEITQDGLVPDYKINSIKEDDVDKSTVSSMTMIMSGFNAIVETEKFDFVILLGDRHEIFAISTVCLVHNIPIVHLHGGEVTIGAIDEQFRHSISKMSTLHFVIHEEYRQRLINMGELPESVFNYGSIAVEQIKKSSLKSLEQLKIILNVPFDLNEPYAVMTYHPETHGNLHYEEKLSLILGCIKDWGLNCIITKANADKDGELINHILDRIVSTNKNRFILIDSLGSLNYWSIIKHSKLVIGNSSSSIIELPSLKIPIINIGDRQKGRIKQLNIIDVGYSINELNESYEKIATDDFHQNISKMNNEFEGENTLEKIVNTTMEYFLDKNNLSKKVFYDIKIENRQHD